MKKLLIIISILAIAGTVWAGEEGIPDFGWWFEPGSPEAASCPKGYGMYMYKYGTPENHTTRYECGDGPTYGKVYKFNDITPIEKKEKSCRWEYKTIFHSLGEPPIILKNKDDGMVMDDSWELIEIIPCFKNSNDINPDSWVYYWLKRQVCE